MLVCRIEETARTERAVERETRLAISEEVGYIIVWRTFVEDVGDEGGGEREPGHREHSL
jgi:hypothetical protein